MPPTGGRAPPPLLLHQHSHSQFGAFSLANTTVRTPVEVVTALLPTKLPQVTFKARKAGSAARNGWPSATHTSAPASESPSATGPEPEPVLLPEPTLLLWQILAHSASALIPKHCDPCSGTSIHPVAASLTHSPSCYTCLLSPPLRRTLCTLSRFSSSGQPLPAHCYDIIHLTTSPTNLSTIWFLRLRAGHSQRRFSTSHRDRIYAPLVQSACLSLSCRLCPLCPPASADNEK